MVDFCRKEHRCEGIAAPNNMQPSVKAACLVQLPFQNSTCAVSGLPQCVPGMDIPAWKGGKPAEGRTKRCAAIHVSAVLAGVWMCLWSRVTGPKTGSSGVLVHVGCWSWVLHAEGRGLTCQRLASAARAPPSVQTAGASNNAAAFSLFLGEVSVDHCQCFWLEGGGRLPLQCPNSHHTRTDASCTTCRLAGVCRPQGSHAAGMW